MKIGEEFKEFTWKPGTKALREITEKRGLEGIRDFLFWKKARQRPPPADSHPSVDWSGPQRKPADSENDMLTMFTASLPILQQQRNKTGYT